MARPRKPEHAALTVITNLRTTKAWRDRAHKQARQRGLTLSEYLRHLVEQDSAA